MSAARIETLRQLGDLVLKQYDEGVAADADVWDFGEAVLEHVRHAAPIPSMDDRASRAERLDIADVRGLVEAFREMGAADWDEELGGVRLQGRSLIAELEEGVRYFDPAQEQWGQFEGYLRLMYLDSTFHRLSVLGAATGARVDPARSVLRHHLRAEDKAAVLRIWASILAELDERTPGHIAKESLLSPSDFFFASGDDEELIGKIVDYVLVYRPRAVVAAHQSGRDAVVNLLPGLASLVTMEPTERLSAAEGRLLRTLAELFRRWGTQDSARFLRALGMESTSAPWFLRSAKREDPSRHPAHGTPATAKWVVPQLTKLLLMAADYVGPASPIERALLQYKLGLEVCLPESRPQPIPGELTLQKQLARFLIERGIYCVGTKFGPSEADLLSQLGGEAFVIEVKLCKRGITPANVENALAQLSVYMGQQQVAARGVLLVYNLTRKPLLAPMSWVHGRYWILPVNLPDCTPSKMKKMLEVREGTGGRLIDTLEVELDPGGGR
ncbi:MAG: hypothetical protein H6719_05935 [Sandaracinaceae bacterium]|nr:hypothetical protein [Sandaracinaceae bacterium]